MTKKKRDPRKIQKQHHWKQFEAPWEDDPGPGFQEYRFDITTPSPAPGPSGRGPDTGVKCFRCGRDTYRAIGSRDSEEVLANLPEEQWRRSQGRGDPKAAPTVLLLICPTCEHGCQMRLETVERIRHAKEVSDV